jgi:hypothetical protein
MKGNLVMNNFWSQLASNVQGNGDNSDIGLLKESKTVLKIVAEEGVKERQDTSWFRDFYQYFNDNPKPSKKYMVHAVCLREGDKEGDRKVKPWVLNASSFAQLISLIADPDFDVLSPAEGTPVSISKSGQGMNTKYNIQAVSKVFDSSEYSTDTCLSLEQAIEQLTKPKDKPANNDETEIEW